MGRTSSQAWLWVMLVVASLFCLPRSALACTMQIEHKLVGVPSAGATDVPTDVQPTISLYDLDPTRVADVEIKLISERGDEVAFTLESPYVSDAVIVPDQPLAPQTRYTLAATVRTVDGTTLLSSEFRTGEGKLAAKPVPPRTSLQHYKIVRSVEPSCGPPASGTCVPLSAGEVVEVRHIDDLGQRDEPYLYRGGFYVNLSGIDQGTSFTCIELRTRALNGALSEPTVLCGEDFPLQTFSGEGPLECTDTGLVTDLMPKSKAASGCSVSHGQPARESAAFFALAFAVWVQVRRTHVRSPRRP